MASIEYLHPSVMTRIVDDSYVAVSAQGQTALFAPHFSSLGKDGVVVEYNAEPEFLHLTGDLNFAKYGQSSFNIASWLRNGGKVYGLRLLPEDAKFANILLGVNVNNSTFGVTAKADTANNASEATMTSALSTTIADLKTNHTNVTVPLGYIYPNGRGEGYNNIGIRIALRTDKDNDYDFRTYNMSVTGKDATGADMVVDGPYVVSFDPEARNTAGESLFWEYVMNKYSSVRVKARRNAFDLLSDYAFSLSSSYGDGTPKEGASPRQVDILFGEERETFTASPKVHDGITITPHTTNKDFADLSKVQYLTGGSDGTFTGGNTKEALLVKAFRGLVDASVTDPTLYPIDVVLDANWPAAVKTEINNFCSDIRGDCVGMVDLGFQATPAQTVDERKNKVNFSSRYTSIWGQHFNVFDPNSGESIQVTTPYFLASKVPAIDSQYGIQYPFVGPRRGNISGFDSINFIPNEAWKENLYKAQVNYVERDTKQTNLATQKTSQVRNSALSDINNMRVLCRIKRETEELLSDYRLEFNDKDTQDSISYNLNQMLQKWTANRACTAISAQVYASEYDRQTRTLRVRISVQFNYVIERIFVDINVKR